MKKLITTLLLLHLLTVAGLGVFLASTGRVDKQKLLTMLDLLKHPGSPANLREATWNILEGTPATETAPASSQAATGPAPEAAASAADRLDASRRTLEAERLKLDNEARNLRHRQELLDKLLADVQERIAQVEHERKAFEDRVKVVDAAARDAAFQKTLRLYDELKPRQVKDIFLTLAPDLVGQYLLAMDTERAGRVIAEFKTPEDKAFITGVLERIRTAAPGGTIGASPTGPAVSEGTQARS